MSKLNTQEILEELSSFTKVRNKKGIYSLTVKILYKSADGRELYCLDNFNKALDLVGWVSMKIVDGFQVYKIVNQIDPSQTLELGFAG